MALATTVSVTCFAIATVVFVILAFTLVGNALDDIIRMGGKLLR